MDESENSHKKNWHDKYYKLMILIPLVLIIISIIVVSVTYQNTGGFFKKDITLTGGTSITVYDGNVSSTALQTALSSKLPELNTRSIYDFGTNQQKAIVIETTATWTQAKGILENYLHYNLTEGQNTDVQYTGSTLSNSFYQQLLIAILVAFIFMAIVVFLLFRTLVPSSAVILSAFADILMTLAVVDIFGMKVSTAGIVAFLMLIGYSVDTDILLTTRMLKRGEGTLNSRIFGAFKTGITMTLTSFFAIGVALIVVKSFSIVLAQIFTILVVGLFFDMFNTWITNVSILKLYMEHKYQKEAHK